MTKPPRSNDRNDRSRGSYGGRDRRDPQYSRDNRKPAPQRPRKDRPDHAEQGGYENLIAGRNAVQEALKAGQRIDTLYIAPGQTGSITRIVAAAKELGFPIKEVSNEKLDAMSGGMNHQGVILTLSAAEYVEVADILKAAADKGEAPFLIIADEIEDPHNLGALIRTAETAGAHGLVIPKRRGVGLTSAVFKSSAGAAAHLPVARVANLASAVEELKAQGIWVYGCDMDGQPWCQVDFSGGVALIVGSEGRGMNRLLKDKCDVMVTLPMQGEITSLNASVAGGIIMYEVARQRLALTAFAPKAKV